MNEEERKRLESALTEFIHQNKKLEKRVEVLESLFRWSFFIGPLVIVALFGLIGYLSRQMGL